MEVTVATEGNNPHFDDWKVKGMIHFWTIVDEVDKIWQKPDQERKLER